MGATWSPVPKGDCAAGRNGTAGRPSRLPAGAAADHGQHFTDQCARADRPNRPGWWARDAAQLPDDLWRLLPETFKRTIQLNGRAVAFSSPHEAIENGLGLIAEDRKQQSLILERSVTENTSLAALRQFLNRLTIVKRSAERQAVQRVIHDLNVKTPTIETLVANLSGGNQQKVVIGKFLLSEIVLFLLDEPTRGIDVGAKAEIYHLVGQLARNGTAFLLVSSEMPELLAVCDRIYVLCEGRLTAEFSREAFDQEAIMEAATRFIEKINHREAEEAS
ncbi:MAG: ATP-binding cassette domain-containing protein [Anaerolineae bacterium]